MDYSSNLNSQHTIQTIVRRLPSSPCFKWAKVVANIRREDREPEVTDLTAFIEARVNNLCSDYGEIALSLASKERARKRPLLSGQIHGRNIHSTQTLAPRIDPFCGVCREAQYPDHCACNGPHHHLLHLNVVQNDGEPSVSSHQTTLHHSGQAFPHISSRGVALAIVPVIVRNGAQTISKCAFLDNGSDSSFIPQALATRLNLRGQHTKLTLKTLNDNKTLQSTE
ncbi:hypothetical protein X801_08691, partial [Opisthorchis viverrini]